MGKQPRTKEELLAQVDELERVAKRMAERGMFSTSGYPNASKPLPKQSGEYAEIKIWRADGRVETMRCEITGLEVRDPTSGLIKSIPSGIRPRYLEGDVFTISGRMRPWKRGPDGRPTT